LQAKHPYSVIASSAGAKQSPNQGEDCYVALVSTPALLGGAGAGVHAGASVRASLWLAHSTSGPSP